MFGSTAHAHGGHAAATATISSGSSPALGTAASISAVLPIDTGSPSATAIPGWSAVRQRLLKKIWALEFVDMGELLPASWRLELAEEGCCQSRCPRHGLVMDLLLWTECYATLVAVLSVHYPHKAPHFMAYLRTIIRASHNFEGVAWASCDMAYRRQAANQHSLDWGG